LRAVLPSERRTRYQRSVVLRSQPMTKKRSAVSEESSGMQAERMRARVRGLPDQLVSAYRQRSPPLWRRWMRPEFEKTGGAAKELWRELLMG